MCVTAATAGIITGIVSTVVSTGLSVAQASAAADAQAESNERSAQAAADQQSARSAQQNAKARELAMVKNRQAFNIERQGLEQQATNAASQAGLEGNFIGDVSRALNLSVDEEQSALAVSTMFAQAEDVRAGKIFEQQRRNAVAKLPTGGSTALTIGSSLMDGIGQGINTGAAAYNSGLFKKG